MKKYINYLSFIIILLSVYLSFKSQLPFKITKADAPKTEFSTERALVQLKEISKLPHYVGSADHARVRNYIKSELEKLGLQVEIQEQVIFKKKWGAGIKAQNIIAKIKGKGNGKALLLLSHYDSAANASFGASDDGTGVATILEGLRAFLAKNTQVENDIIILISDAEEIGLLGASAFVEHHPWAKDVGLVINFEARGTSGTSYMLIETNGGNKQMVKEFTKANPDVPVGNSLMYSVYKMLPNDTDLTAFREDGDIEGFNFAFIDDFFNYHMASDNLENVNPKSLEHQGTYLMAMLNHFSNTDLSKLKNDTDYIYFNFPLIGMVYYPFSWIFPMLILAILLFAILIFLGFKKGKMTWKALGIGFLAFLIILIGAPALTFFAWKGILLIHPQYNDIIHGFTYNGYYYIAAFSALTIGLAFLVYQLLLKKQDAINLMVAPLFVWIIISLFSAIYLQGAAFFIVPVYFGLAILTILIYNDNENTKIISATLLSLPVLVLFSPLIQMFPVGLGLGMLALSPLFIVLIFGMLIPTLSFLKHNKISSYVFLAISVLLLLTASFKSGYNTEQKKQNSLLYVADYDNNKAYWASYDRDIDNWTKKYLGEQPNKGSFDTSKTQSHYFKKIKLFKEAEMKNFLTAKIETVTDTVIDDHRELKIIIKPQRKDNRIHLVANIDIEFKVLQINGLKLSPDSTQNTLQVKRGKDIVYYLSENENLELSFNIQKGKPAEFKLFEISHDLLSNKLIKVQERPDEMTQLPFYINDAIVLIRTIKF